MAKSARYFLRMFREIISKRNVKYILTFSIFILIFNKFFNNARENYIVKNIALRADLVEPHQRFEKSADDQTGEEKEWKNILLWTKYFGYPNVWKKMFRRHFNKECKEYRCRIFSNQKNYMQADAILFHGNDLQQMPSFLGAFQRSFVFPKKRIQSQIYIFFSLEPPPNMGLVELNLYQNFFNWTMTYRTDSDVYAPYAQVIKSDKKDPSSKYIPIKAEDLKNRKMAAWMVSHCPTDSKREVFVKELQRFVPVDVYGKCGTLKCGRATTLPLLVPGAADPCDNVTQKYAFYLSLENALCKDYVTEKFYRALTLGVIPIVMGGVNYSSIAPPKSYIDIKDFNSVADLAKHMKEVAGDINLYNEYFKWKDFYDIEIGHPYKPLVCGLCEKLHATDLARESKTYKDIYKWYNEDASCHPWK